MRPVRVAIVDDSAFIRKALTRMLANEPAVEVVGAAESGEELLDHLQRWRPHVITLDLTMPGIGGLQTLDRIMVERPTPVIILSTHAGEDAPLTIEALHRGAVDFIDKQRYSLMDFGTLRSVLLEKIVQVTTATATGGAQHARGAESRPAAKEKEPRPKPKAVKPRPPVAVRHDFELIVMGASTGGPPTIERILTDLGEDVGIPLVIAQHMPPRFTEAFAERLNAHLPIQVREAREDELLVGSTAYIAPGGRHLRLQRDAENRLRVRLGSGSEREVHQPSVDVLFASAARCCGERVLAILLTGMGKDGAEGMADLRRSGAWTIAQDRDSCVVYGMPQAAVALGAVRESLPTDRIGSRVRRLLKADPERESDSA